MSNHSVATQVWCVKRKRRRGMHRLRVRTSDVRAAWSKLDATAQKNSNGNVQAFCPDSNCPEHHRLVFVGLNRIPGLKKIVDG